MERSTFIGAALVFAALQACSAAGGGPNGAEGGGGATGVGAGSGTGGNLLDLPDGGTTVDPDAACLTDTYGAQAAPANLLFQVDVSGSMNCAPLDTGCGVAEPSAGSRWEVFKAQLIAALDTLPSTSGVGLMHYPTGLGTFQGDPTGCAPQVPDVALGAIVSAKPQVAAKLAAISPAGGTPTHDAVKDALAVLAQSTLPGNEFLVLATDGQATFCAGCDLFCTSSELDDDNQVLIQEVAAAAASGVRTFVLGAPGSNAYRSILSKIASAGQTEATPGCSSTGPSYCHYDMTTAPDFGDALAAALAAIGGAVLTCTYDIPQNAGGTFDPARVNVQLTAGGKTTDIPKDPSHTGGWDYSADGKQIILYGTACDAAKAVNEGTIKILYGCPTIVK